MTLCDLPTLPAVDEKGGMRVRAARVQRVSTTAKTLLAQLLRGATLEDAIAHAAAAAAALPITGKRGRTGNEAATRKVKRKFEG